MLLTTFNIYKLLVEVVATSIFSLSYFSKQSMSLLMYRGIICLWSVHLALAVGSHNMKYSQINSLTTRLLSETQGTLCLAMKIGFTSVDTSALRTTAIDQKKIHFNVRGDVTRCRFWCLVCNWGYRDHFFLRR